LLACDEVRNRILNGPGHWSTLLVAGTGWVFVVGTRREPGDGLARSPFDGHDDTAAPGSSEALSVNMG